MLLTCGAAALGRPSSHPQLIPPMKVTPLRTRRSSSLPCIRCGRPLSQIGSQVGHIHSLRSPGFPELRLIYKVYKQALCVCVCVCVCVCAYVGFSEKDMIKLEDYGFITI